MSPGFHLHADFVTESVHLACAGSRCDDEKIHDRRHTSQVKHHRVLTAVLFANFGNMAGVFQAALQSVLGSGGGNGGGNGNAPAVKIK